VTKIRSQILHIFAKRTTGLQQHKSSTTHARGGGRAMASNSDTTESFLQTEFTDQPHPSSKEPKTHLDADPPPIRAIRDRSYHIDIWTKIFTTFAALFFGIWSILSWKSSKNANEIASQANDIASNTNYIESQAVAAQVQANQLALYNFCALNLVCPPCFS
jgi:hypothetical protein